MFRLHPYAAIALALACAAPTDAQDLLGDDELDALINNVQKKTKGTPALPTLPADPTNRRPSTVPVKDVTADPVIAEKLLSSAEQYQRGIGVRANPERAVEIYRKVAKTGHPKASFHLARCLLQGEGVRRDGVTGRLMIKKLAKDLATHPNFRLVKGINPITGQRYKHLREIKLGKKPLRTFTTKAGQKLESPKVLSLTEKGMRLMHSAGVSAVRWDDVPGYVRTSVGYDPTSVLLETEIVLAKKRQATAKR